MKVMYHPAFGLCKVQDTFLFGIFSIVEAEDETGEEHTYIVLTKKLLKPIRIILKDDNV
jgi:hypothetical protein